MGEDCQPTNAILPAQTALVVDEHEIARYGCVELLQRHGFGACYQAGSISQACRVFVRRRPAVIIQAWPLAGRASLQLLRWVRGQDHGCPIIVYASHDDAYGTMDALRAGAAGFVTKSGPPEFLFEAVRRALRGGIYIRPDLAQKLALSRSMQLD
ncbi:MAG: response regulator transcription factor, partial [Salinisphaera sp.]|nr:response regulator transcription factor [Salinisphaera sp.]